MRFSGQDRVEGEQNELAAQGAPASRVVTGCDLRPQHLLKDHKTLLKTSCEGCVLAGQRWGKLGLDSQVAI